MTDSDSPRVVIVGGGLAGLSAAVSLAPHRLNVELLEARRGCGGRAGSYTDPVQQQDVDYCQHVGMGCCTHLLHFLDATEQLPAWQRARELTFIDRTGSRYRLIADRWLPAPLHLTRSMLRQGYLPWATRLAIATSLLRLARDSKGPRDGRFYAWLESQRQLPVAIDRFWNVILTSALGEDVRHVAYKPARKVFVDGFLRNSTAYEVLIPKLALATLFGQRVPQWLQRHGISVRSGAAVRDLLIEGNRATHVVLNDGTKIAADHFIIAVPWHQLERTLGESAMRVVPNIERFREIPSAPISGVHLWLDRPITELPHAVFIDRLSQWMFRRGETGPQAAPQEESPREHYVQVVISASRGLAGRERESVIEEILDDLRASFPQAREAKLLRAKIVTDPWAVFSVTPAVEQLRPNASTALENLFLAGDWTRTGWPATMEGAIISGQRAAQCVLGPNLHHPPRQSPAPLPTSWLARLLIRDEPAP